MDFAVSMETWTIRKSREIQLNLKRTLAKLRQRTGENWFIYSLLRMPFAPRAKLKFSAFELM